MNPQNLADNRFLQFFLSFFCGLAETFYLCDRKDKANATHPVYIRQFPAMAGTQCPAAGMPCD
jgi:hypothetical protein